MSEFWGGFVGDQAGFQGAVLSQGFAESMSPGIVGFALLSLTWLVVSVGLRRIGRLDPPAHV
jgi:hypothetical protein